VHNRQLLQAYSSMAVGEFTFLKHCWAEKSSPIIFLSTIHRLFLQFEAKRARIPQLLSLKVGFRSSPFLKLRYGSYRS
jgi:hypothetical protein